MKEIEIKFTDFTTFVGRNGVGKCSGIEVSKNPSLEFVVLRPLTSKNVTGNCNIVIPIENVPAFIEALKAMNESERSQREEDIKRIKDILITWGSTSCTECERDHSPSFYSTGNGGGNVCELVEELNADGVETIVYDDENEVDWNNYTYEELPDEIIAEILEIVEEYEADMLKTEKRCQN